MQYECVITKTPLRISFFGGSTDYINFIKKNGTTIISTSIDKYVYLIVKKHGKQYPDKYRITYSSVEKVNKIENISNDIVREAIRKFKIYFPISITIVNDIPAGSGLGSSSVFTIGLCKAIRKLLGLKINNKILLNDAIDIEINRLKNPIGIQDYLPALYGSLRVYNIDKRVNIKNIKVNNYINQKIFKNLFLLWTGSFRDASTILKDQKKIIDKKDTYFNEIKKYSTDIKNILNLKKFNLNLFGEKLINSWEIKKKLSNKIFNRKLKKIEKDIINSGSLGYKLLGAGGEGFYLVLGNKNCYEFLINKYHKESIIKFNCEENPSSFLYLKK